jgi:carbamoyl-phosphate synthase small subunit
MKYISKRKAVLLLEDGTFYEGEAIGAEGTSGGEICFNTGMTGYQEIYTDPSYYGQIVVNTNSHIGNYGTLSAEQESNSPKISGLVVNSFSNGFSRPTGEESLDSYLIKNNTVGICGLDARALVRHIRDKGAMNAVISSVEFDRLVLSQKLQSIPSMDNLELSSKVTTDKPYLLGDETSEYRIAVLDLGCKKSILSNFVDRGVFCKVFPAKTKFSEMEDWNPDGYFISNGPGDPSAMKYATDTVKEILASNQPLFGICLGHQILAQACGIPTYKMHHGHRGLNHPVKNILTGKGEITSQNHGFAVDFDALEMANNVELTHVNLNDGTVAGIRLKDHDAFSVQYHPESSPGPHDSRYLFDDFINILKSKK